MAQVYILENNGFPIRNAGHTAFTNVPSITKAVKGDILLFVYDGPAPAAGFHQGFCFGAFFFDGSQWEYNTPHDAGHTAYEPPTSDLTALGTSAVAAFYNGPTSAEMAAVRWKAAGNSGVVAWVGPKGIHLNTYHGGDGTLDRELEVPLTDGVTVADMPATRVFHPEFLDKAPAAGSAVTDPGAVTGATGTTTPAPVTTPVTAPVTTPPAATATPAPAAAGDPAGYLGAGPSSTAFKPSSVGGWYLSSVLGHR
jgi:hypothetical protein